MEGIICSRKPRKKKRKAKSKQLKLVQTLPLKNKSILKQAREQSSSQKLETEVEHNLRSLTEDLCDPQKQSENCAEWRRWKENPLEQTIDLCENDSVVDCSDSSVVIVPAVEVEKQNKTVSDQRENVPKKEEKEEEEEEVIDLTEPVNMPKSNYEPCVIDISEDDSIEKKNFKAENDEILVIGTFSNCYRYKNKYNNSSCVHFRNKWKNINNLTSCSDNLRSKYIKKKSVLDTVDKEPKNKSQKEILESGETSNSIQTVSSIGENIYVNSPVDIPSTGLRPIIIDGSNVAFVHSDSNFSCKRLEICINYFKEKGHKVTAFVPQFRINSNKSDDPRLLRKLERQGDVVLTPSKRIDGRNIVPYDDRFIVQTAVLKGGIIVSRDNYNDLLRENPAWAETIKYRTLAFIWVDDTLMFPKDPLGEHGPSLEEFLRFH